MRSFGPLEQAHPVTQPEYACKSILCVLEKGPMSRWSDGTDEAVEAMTQNPEPGYEFYGTELPMPFVQSRGLAPTASPRHIAA